MTWRVGQVGAAAALLLSLAAGGFAADTTGTASAPDVMNAGGEDVYSHICQACHMSEAQGAVGAGHYPKLAGDPALASWQYVAMTVLGGRNGMPAFGQPARVDPSNFGSVHLSDEKVAEVINYVRSHFGNKYKDKVSAAQVAKLPHPGSG
jgi:mono/diheme cytochrome c family protein